MAGAVTIEEVIAALRDLTRRCDGAEGVRADGSNIETMQANFLLARIDSDDAARLADQERQAAIWSALALPCGMTHVALFTANPDDAEATTLRAASLADPATQAAMALTDDEVDDLVAGAES